MESQPQNPENFHPCILHCYRTLKIEHKLLNSGLLLNFLTPFHFSLNVNFIFLVRCIKRLFCLLIVNIIYKHIFRNLIYIQIDQMLHLVHVTTDSEYYPSFRGQSSVYSMPQSNSIFQYVI